MNIIHWVHILDNKGSTFFNLETQEQESAGPTSPLMSRLIFSLQSIAKDLEVNVVQSVEMGNNRFFLCKEQKANYLFILKTNRDADAGVITPVIEEIISKYHERFLGFDGFNINDKIKRLNSLSNDVKQIISIKSDD